MVIRAKVDVQNVPAASRDSYAFKEFSSMAVLSQYQLSISSDLKDVTTSKHPHLSNQPPTKRINRYEPALLAGSAAQM